MTGSKPTSGKPVRGSNSGKLSGPNRGNSRRQTGQAGEAAAVNLLQSKGYRIIARNWRCRTGELDIVAEHNQTLIFIEVRTRRPTGTFGTAKESVNARKQQQVRETAQFYLHATKQYSTKLRFDVIAVELSLSSPSDDSILSIEHIENAF